MKIGLMHNLYGEFKRGGAETVVQKMADELRSGGHEVFLITTKPPRAEISRMANDKSGLRIYYVTSNFYKLGDASLSYRALWQIANIFSIRKYHQIKTILQAEKPVLAITHNLMGLGFLAPFVLRRLNIRQEHFLHDIQLLHPSGLLLWGQEKKIAGLGAQIYQALTRRLFAAPAKVISPSRWLLGLHQKHGFFKDSQTEIRPFRLESHESNDSRPISGRRAKNFLFVGQLETHKGVFLLLEVFKKIGDPNLTLLIVGDGQKMAAAQAAAASDSRIEFRGRLDSQAVQEAMRASDCLIVPSLCYENSPTVIYEARAAGLPVIAANLGGIPEIIESDDRLFQPGDEDDLRIKIEESIK